MQPGPPAGGLGGAPPPGGPIGYYAPPPGTGARPAAILLFRVYAIVSALAVTAFLLLWQFLTPAGGRTSALEWLGLFVLSFIMLGAVGAGITSEKIPEWFGANADVTTIENAFGRFWLIVYFAFFAFLWAYTYFKKEKTRPVPDRVTTHD